jgi:hypothetical protein
MPPLVGRVLEVRTGFAQSRVSVLVSCLGFCCSGWPACRLKDTHPAGATKDFIQHKIVFIRPALGFSQVAGVVAVPS